MLLAEDALDWYRSDDAPSLLHEDEVHRYRFVQSSRSSIQDDQHRLKWNDSCPLDKSPFRHGYCCVRLVGELRFAFQQFSDSRRERDEVRHNLQNSYCNNLTFAVDAFV